MAEDILSMLSGGDRRSIGRAEDALKELECNQDLLNRLFNGMLGDDPVVAMRAADVAEKYSLSHPGCLQPYKKVLLEQVAPLQQQEIRWHTAQMIPRLQLSDVEINQAMDILRNYLKDKSSIVQTFALQSLVDLGRDDINQLPRIRKLLEEAIRSGTPAMRSRGKKLLAEVERKRKGG